MDNPETLAAPSGFSNVYLLSRDCPISCVLSVSGLYIFYYIASSVFSNVYLLPRVCPMSCVPSVASVSGMFVLDCRLGFL
jgi:hypothetical protein